jgi:diguanylate cyclase (GGDEF)-like protein
LEQAERELSRMKRYGRPSSMVMLDVDHFKTVNDTYGHGVGDQVLKKIAELAGIAIRPTDVFGRLGGEEFAVILSETDAEQALVVAERLRTAIADEPMRLSNGTALRVWALLVKQEDYRAPVAVVA